MGLGVGSRKFSRIHGTGWPAPRKCSPSLVFAHLRIFLPALLALAALPALARDKEKHTYGEGLIVNVAMPESVVERVVADVVENGVIRGTKEYNKEEFVSGAVAAASCRVFPPWTDGGKVFYKVREHALDPRNFKDGGDMGTLAVRYVLQPQGDKNTVLRIDALFQEDFRHVVHQSDGSVESNEYRDIRDHLDAIELMAKQDAEALKEREEQIARKREMAGEGQEATGGQVSSSSAEQSGSDYAAASTATPINSATPEPTPVSQTIPGQTLEERVKYLRRQVQRAVKAPGAPLKSAPFHTASTLQSLNAGTEVLILISTPYWLGVETHDGQHGWMMRDELEQRP